jgi:hypothetical protein
MTAIKVFISSRDSTCDECRENLGHGAWITLNQERGALCLACADLDHLIFLPSGNTALTRRAGKHSPLSAVVLKWSRSRKRFERKGLLVATAALELAEQECLADADARSRRQERAAERRGEQDREYLQQFAARVRELFPRCPAGRDHVIAEHACLKYSGRVGRSAAAKDLDAKAITLAVVAHIRHAETVYDTLLARGEGREEARAAIQMQVGAMVDAWSAK